MPNITRSMENLKWINWSDWSRRIFCFFGWHIERPVYEYYDQHYYGDMREQWACSCEKVSYSV